MTTLNPAARTASTSTVDSSATAYVSRARGGKPMSPISPGSTRRKSSRLKKRSILRRPSSARSAPVSSKKRITTDCGSSGTRRTVMAPRLSGRPAWKRVTGTDATSRSTTLTPAALSPAIIARFSMRADRLESRQVMTVASFFSVVP